MFISSNLGNAYEPQYMGIVKNILRNGTCEENSRTHQFTKRIPHQIISVDLSKEFPILKSKKVAFKTATDEIMWIMQKQSNDIHDLNSRIWDEWADENGKIGMAYGSVIREYHQIDALLDAIKTNPSDRGMILNLWDLANLHKMRERPCCLMSIWSVISGKLNCQLIQRSGDMMVGVPFNTTQYASLLLMIAQATGTAPGLLTHVIADAHIYDNQIETAGIQLKRWELLEKYDNHLAFTPDAGNSKLVEELKVTPETLEQLNTIIKCRPKVILNPEVTNFYDFTLDDLKLEDYHNMGVLKYKVAVGDLYAGRNAYNSSKGQSIEDEI